MKEKKSPSLQFHKRYGSTYVVTADFCSIHLFEREENKTSRGTIFIHDPFHEV